MRCTLLVMLVAIASVANADDIPMHKLMPEVTPRPVLSAETKIECVCQCESSNAWIWAAAGVVASSVVWGVFWYQRRKE